MDESRRSSRLAPGSYHQLPAQPNMNENRNAGLSGLAVASVLLLLPGPVRADDQIHDRPNIIIVLVDDMAY